MTPNPKIRELIVSMGIIPESEHYDIAEQVIRQCAVVAHNTAEGETTYGWMVGNKIKQHFGVEE